MRDVACWLVLALAVAAAFPSLLLGRAVFFAGDMELLNYPFRAWFAASWRQGVMPWWCPPLQYGYPLFAEAQAGAAYPPGWLQAVTTPLWRPMGWLLLAHLWWGGVGMFTWCRVLGARRSGALTAGLAFALGGTMVSYLRFVNLSCGLAWAPWALAWFELAVRGRPRAAFAAGSAGAMSLLAGFPGVSVVILLLLAERSVRARQGRPWLVVAGLTIGLGAVQWVPLAELIPHTSRDQVATWSPAAGTVLRPAALAWQMVPATPSRPMPPGDARDLPWEWNHSLGRLAWLLALAGLLGDRRVRPYAWIALVGVILAAGVGLMPPFGLVPGLRPLRWMMLAALAAGPLIAAGVDAPTGPVRRPLLLALVIPALGLPFANLGRADLAAWILAAGAILAGGWLLGRPRGAGWRGLVVAAAAVDLVLLAGPTWPLAAPDYWRARDPLTARLRGSGRRAHGGFWTHRELGAPRNLVHGVASTGLLSPLGLRDREALNARLERLLTSDRPAAEALAARLRIGAVPGAVLGSPSRMVAWPSRAWPPAWLESPFAARAVDRPTPNRARVFLGATTNARVIIADGAYPGWRAFVDGIERDWAPVESAERAVAARRGERELRWVFAPVSVRLGMFVTLATLAATVAAGLALPLSRRAES